MRKKLLVHGDNTEEALSRGRLVLKSNVNILFKYFVPHSSSFNLKTVLKDSNDSNLSLNCV